MQLYWNRTLAWVFSCKFDAYFQNTFSSEHLWTAASVIFMLPKLLDFRSEDIQSYLRMYHQQLKKSLAETCKHILKGLLHIKWGFIIDLFWILVINACSTNLFAGDLQKSFNKVIWSSVRECFQLQVCLSMCDLLVDIRH